MNIYINLLISLIHFIFAYSILITSLITNKINILIYLLIIMSIVKYSFYYFDRCILSLLEENSHFANIADLLGKSLTYKFNQKEVEEIIINISMLIILNKLLFLILYNYYYKQK